MRTSRAHDRFRLSDEMRSRDLLVAARAYINAGFKVLLTFGITDSCECSCGDAGCPSAGKHPIGGYFTHGAKSATDDMIIIRNALKDHPNANIAIALGNLTVADIDGSQGREQYEALRLPATIRARTARGEHHYFFGPSNAFKAKQLDIKSGASQYVIAPPSRHMSGARYRWFAEPDTLAPTPSKLSTLRKRQLIKPRSQGFDIPIGSRNEALFRLACSLRRRISDDRTIFEMVQVVNQRLCERPLGDDELETAIASSANYKQESEALFGPPAITKSLPMEFLWYPYIPRYGVTIIAGDPGRGKSLLTSLMISVVTKNAQWPFSDERPGGKRVLLLSAEDNWARVTLARLEKAGADISNIRMMQRFKALTEERMDLLSKEIETNTPDLVVIDTLSAYMGGARDMHRQNEVGEFLAALTEMAESVGCAVVGLGHLNKQGGDNPLYRIVGSIGFAASIRSALFLGPNPDDKSQLALAHGKANGSPKGKTIIFSVHGGGRDEAPVLTPVGTSEATEDDVCRVERGPVGRPNVPSEQSEEFILDYLERVGRPMRWEAIKVAAEARSIASEGTLNNARTRLADQGKIVQIGKARNATWALPNILTKPKSK